MSRISFRSVKRLTWAALSPFFLFAVTGPAAGHAILVESVPPHGAALKSAPEEITLRFNARLEQAVSRIHLVDARQVQTPLPSADTGVDRVVVELPPLSPGVYTVVYKVLARDGHVTEGSIRFTVLKP